MVTCYSSCRKPVQISAKQQQQKQSLGSVERWTEMPNTSWGGHKRSWNDSFQHCFVIWEDGSEFLRYHEPLIPWGLKERRMHGAKGKNSSGQWLERSCPSPYPCPSLSQPAVQRPPQHFLPHARLDFLPSFFLLLKATPHLPPPPFLHACLHGSPVLTDNSRTEYSFVSFPFIKLSEVGRLCKSVLGGSMRHRDQIPCSESLQLLSGPIKPLLGGLPPLFLKSLVLSPLLFDRIQPFLLESTSLQSHFKFLKEQIAFFLLNPTNQDKQALPSKWVPNPYWSKWCCSWLLWGFSLYSESCLNFHLSPSIYFCL